MRKFLQKQSLVLLLIIATLSVLHAQNKPFITKWNTTKGNAFVNDDLTTNKQIYFPGVGEGYTIEWEKVGDPSVNGKDDNVTTTLKKPYVINLSEAGEYLVKVSAGKGAFYRIYFGPYGTYSYGDKHKLVEIQQWGDVEWSTMEQAFPSCGNLLITATDAPNLTKVTNMSYMFDGCSLINTDLSSWDVSNVENMDGVFYYCESFNQSLGAWNVKAVSTMENMLSTTGLSIDNYNKTLKGWAENPKTPNNITLGAEGLKYSDKVSHDKLVNEKGWKTIDDKYEEPLVKVESVTITPATLTVNVEDNATLTATVSPAEVVNKTVTWSSENADIATVDDNGKVLGISEGEVKIIATSVADNTKTGECKVTVKLEDKFKLFVTKWKTETTTISFPGVGNGYTIEWAKVGDEENTKGKLENQTSELGTAVDITVPEAGEYIIKISPLVGEFKRIAFHTGGFFGKACGDAKGLLEVQQWGKIAWESMECAFWGCKNMQITAKDKPMLSNVTSMKKMFYKNETLNCDMSKWDVSKVENMESMFQFCKKFNGDITSWKVGNVKTMKSMFSDCPEFNQNIGGWTVDNVTDMTSAFANCSVFNQDLSSWHVDNVTNMFSMFKLCSAFNQSLGAWNLTKVTNMNMMLSNCGMSYENYDKTLKAWANNTNTPNSILLGAKGLEYTDKISRDKLIDEKQWTINGDELKVIAVETISISPKSITLAVDNTRQLTYTITPDNATYKEVKWSSKDETIATVDENGMVTAKVVGSTTIVATSVNDETKKGECLVKVMDVSNQKPFITKWNTNNPSTVIASLPKSTSTQIYFPGVGENYTIEWEKVGDATKKGRMDNVTTTVKNPVLIDFQEAGEFLVKVTAGVGTFTSIAFGKAFTPYADNEKILEVQQWGDIEWTTMSNAFVNCVYLQVTADDIPDLSNVTDLSSMFESCSEFNSDLNTWDVSTVENMSHMFYNCAKFNGNIKDWEVANVTNMKAMFTNCASFNSDISKWKVGKVTNMSMMFSSCTVFNQNIGSWDVSNVKTMFYMFNNSLAFNQDISGWEVTSLENMGGMFYEARMFNQDISKWNVSKVKKMNMAFYNSTMFNSNLGAWDLSSVENMSNMLDASGMNIVNYDKTLKGWAENTNTPNNIILGANTLKYTDKVSRKKLTDDKKWMIYGDKYVDNYVPVSKVIVTPSSLKIAVGVAKALTVSVMPDNATNNNTTWFSENTDIVTIDKYGKLLAVGEGKTRVLAIAVDDNEKVGVCEIEVLEGTGKNLFITKWKSDAMSSDIDGVTKSTNTQIYFPGVGKNYTIKWDKVTDKSVKGIKQVDESVAGSPVLVEFPSAGEYFIRVMANDGGSFNAIQFKGDDGKAYGDCEKLMSIDQWGANIEWKSMKNAFWGCKNMVVNADPSFDMPNVSNVVDMSHMFDGCAQFNTEIIDWNANSAQNTSYMFAGCTELNKNIKLLNTNSVTNMSHMFDGCAKLNSIVENFNTTKVTNMEAMFKGCKVFNQDFVKYWNVSAVTNMKSMFEGCLAVNQILDKWEVGNVENMEAMFKGCVAFNSTIRNWTVSKVTNMKSMFEGCSALNQEVSGWDVSSVTDMSNMFASCSKFNQYLGKWNLGNVTTMEGMLDNCAMNSITYAVNLKDWAANTSTPDNITLGAAKLKYCSIAKDAHKKLIDEKHWTITDDGEDADCEGIDLNAKPFITQWKTDNASTSVNEHMSSGSQIYFPGVGTNYNIKWEDVNDPTHTDSLENISTTERNPLLIDFGKPGEYILKVYPANGTFDRMYCGEWNSLCADVQKLVKIKQWGDIKWTSMNGAFCQCIKMQLVATDTPDLSKVTDISSMFSHCERLNADINNWDVSNVTDMSSLFTCCKVFNNSLSDWDVSNVTTMNEMFAVCEAFNSELNWGDKVGNVTDMFGMFQGCPVFNQDISDWDVSNVENMGFLFHGCFEFNQPIGKWEVDNATNMNAMFNFCYKFNADISGWNVGNVESMEGMFKWCSVFNQDLSKWNTESVTDMSYMFFECSAFNSDVSEWNTENVTNTSFMFFRCNNFNSALNDWEVSNVINMTSMFEGCSIFNQDLNNWEVGSTQYMSMMFSGCTSFNGNVESWDVGLVTEFHGMFAGCELFNQDIGGWDVSSASEIHSMFAGCLSFNHNLSSWVFPQVTNLGFMFNGCEEFDQDLSGWDISYVKNMQGMLDGCGMSCSNYSKTLIGWAEQSVEKNVNLGAAELTYGKDAQEAHDKLTQVENWTISDDEYDDSCELTSIADNAVNMPFMVYPTIVTEGLTIETDVTDNKHKVLDVFSIKGDKIRTITIKSNKQYVDFSKVQSGTYMLKYSDKVVKVVKE